MYLNLIYLHYLRCMKSRGTPLGKPSKGMPLQIDFKNIEEKIHATNPFQRELIRSQVLSYKNKMYKIIEEGFFFGVGGILHFWLWHAVLSSKHIPVTYFVMLSRVKWMKEQREQDLFKPGDLRSCGISPNQVTTLIRHGIAKGHFVKVCHGKYKLTPKGHEFTTKLTKEMYNLVVDVYEPRT